MKKYIFPGLLAIITFLMTIFVNGTWSFNEINQLYIFGDSLSDVGNTAKLTESQYPPTPPYFSGRFSNGPLWVEYLAKDLNLNSDQVTNLAWGGATTKGNVGNIPGLLTQVKRFANTNPTVNSGALAVIWIGANDYLYGTTNVKIPVDNMVEAIFILVQTGIKNFLIVNLPDLGQLPATRTNDISASLSALTKAHNLYLSQTIQRLDQDLDSDIEIVEFDVYSLYKDVINHPDKFGLKNVTKNCLNQKVICEHPENFLFWDSLHPSAVAHQILGEKAFEKVQNTL
ncbi:lipolytic protein G-D-S-L family [Gloeothece citriformis PCC 7424]|uniref:Lipolytic protein G-D-S-L family n=1 Tax=Gloeothece citriformis (strain PCC 7424) TaxID=65393 RepID=B7KHA2_GLOC7|nr:SGNH/GDSL hydrolase family protein [Gloeothece citriformis]ACK69311.1 lipolytic protein G-D-S-L family [Gloeothece citriformis PCC 7424]